MLIQITIKPYERVFRHPLRTARGEWAVREGFILRVECDGQIGYGEVAPLPEFGSETVAEARMFLEQASREPDLAVPKSLPCCAFGLSAALREISLFQDDAPQGVAQRGTFSGEMAGSVPQLESALRVRYATRAESIQACSRREYAVSGLLPAGSGVLRLASDKVAAGYRSLKWKIGVEPIAKELAIARGLMESLPASARVRFDANASLTISTFEQWLDFLVKFPEQVDYIEQPLACGEELAMARYMQASGVSIALDESLNALDGQRWLKPGAWAGPLVVKAPLMGDVAQLARELQPVAAQVVLSSVFETGIGLENSLRLADVLPGLARPIGFDTVVAFEDALNHVPPAPTICANARSAYDPKEVWNLI